MEIPAGEIEFQSNYRLLELGKQTLASPMAALGFPGFTAAQEARNNMEVHLKKLDIYSKCSCCLEHVLHGLVVVRCQDEGFGGSGVYEWREFYSPAGKLQIGLGAVGCRDTREIPLAVAL